MAILNPGEVSEFLRDFPEYNILLDNVQFTEDEINSAIRFTIERYNALTPVTQYTSDNFPNKWILLIGTCAHLMHSEIFLQLRNQATYRDGDIENIGIDDKAALYQALVDRLDNLWNSHAQKIKQQINLESAYGYLSSGYRWIRSGLRSYD